MDNKEIKLQRLTLQALFSEAVSGQPVRLLHTPTGEVQADHQPIGTVNNPRLRAIFSLNGETVRLLQVAEGEVSLPGKKGSLEWLDAKVDRNREVRILRLLASGMNDLFWAGVVEEVPGANDGSELSLSEGWVVSVKLDTCDCEVCRVCRSLELGLAEESDLGANFGNVSVRVVRIS